MNIRPIKKSDVEHRVERPTQSGFSSPATHYNEPRIDLNEVLVDNPSATFYIRVDSDNYDAFNINKNDVLIVDRSKVPLVGQLALGAVEDSFSVFRIEKIAAVELQLWGTIIYVIKSVI